MWIQSSSSGIFGGSLDQSECQNKLINNNLVILALTETKVTCCRCKAVIQTLCFVHFLLVLAQMEIPECPVLRPTFKEFKNFSDFVEKVDRTYKHNYGMVKVVPPPEFKSRCADYDSRLQNLMVLGPIEQNIFGKGGIYECMHIQKKSMTLKEYRAKMGVFDKITEGLSAPEVEATFWKNIVFSPPIYGADLLNTLMDQRAGSWNLNSLDSLLSQAINIKVRGVTSSYCYIGSWKTMFCWHKEDLDLSAINFLHEGKSKFWYSIPANQGYILEKEARIHFPEHFSKCSEHLRHKTTLINPYLLKRKYPELKISKMEHKAGQFMLVLGGSYHCGFNFGLNIAEAINYGTLDWLNQLPVAKACQCSRNSVKAEHTEIFKNLEKTDYGKTKEFDRFKSFVYQEVEKEEEEQEKAHEAVAVKLEFSKKIRKQNREPKKINYKGDEYKVENWAQCDKCHLWRKLQKGVKAEDAFRCKDTGKACHKKDKVGKDEHYILL